MATTCAAWIESAERRCVVLAGGHERKHSVVQIFTHLIRGNKIGFVCVLPRHYETSSSKVETPNVGIDRLAAFGESVSNDGLGQF